MLAVINWFLSPLGRYAALGLTILAIIGFIYGKGHHDASVSIKEKIQRESTKAVTKANNARDAATQRFDAGRLRNDGWLRDK